MRRMLSSFNRRALSQTRDRDQPDESPEAIILREVKAFCESDRGANGATDDYVHLPAIVEAAESSPDAAREAALRIRRYLANPSKPRGLAQYNAIMLIRILAENPGPTFTRNLDDKFVVTVKQLLRDGRDKEALQILRETLDSFEARKSADEGLAPLIAMWKKEKERVAKAYRRPPPGAYAGGSSHHRPKVLPPPDELAARISEARTSATLLIQLSQSTPPTEVPSNDLMKEFSERCQAASRSIQAYMECDNPPPDEDTLLTLIETNDQLSVALSRYQRAVLNSRKALSNGNSNSSTSSNNSNSNSNSNGNSPSPPEARDRSLPARPSEAGPVRTAAPAAASSPPPPPPRTRTTRYEYNPEEFQVQNPFADPVTRTNSEHESVSPIAAR